MAKEELKKVKVNKTAEAILALADAIHGLETKIDKFLEAPKAVEPVKQPVSNMTPTPPSQSEVVPFPFSWRMIIDEVLSPTFKAEVFYRTDARFELSIFVPEKYSNASKPHWETMHEDKRFMVIDNALGEAGVKQFCDKIAENLGQEIRFKIAQDKATAQ